MHIKFLTGQDKEFINYEDIDNNPEYDDIDQINKDYEEVYFNEDVALEEPAKVSEYTGEQDY